MMVMMMMNMVMMMMTIDQEKLPKIYLVDYWAFTRFTKVEIMKKSRIEKNAILDGFSTVSYKWDRMGMCVGISEKVSQARCDTNTNTTKQKYKYSSKEIQEGCCNQIKLKKTYKKGVKNYKKNMKL